MTLADEKKVSSEEFKTIEEKKSKRSIFSRPSLFWVCFIIFSFPISFLFFDSISNTIPRKVKSALEKFKTENNHYPEDLDQLTPKFLEKIPDGIMAYSFDKEKMTYRFLFAKQGLVLFPDEVWYQGGNLSEKPGY